MKTLADRVAVVTGAANGVGRATSVALAREGCNLAICDVDAEGLADTASMIQALGRQAHVATVDVSNKEQMRLYADSVWNKFGRVDLLVNNAGVTCIANFEDHTLEHWEWIVGINLWGVIYGCTFFLPYLKRSDQARIVNVSSSMGLIGLSQLSSYTTTKFAVRGLSEALSVELDPEEVGVTCVYLHGVRTGIARNARTTDPRLQQEAMSILARQRFAPEQCADVIVRAIKSGRSRVLVGREIGFIDAVARLAPVSTQRVLRFVGRYGLLSSQEKFAFGRAVLKTLQRRAGISSGD